MKKFIFGFMGVSFASVALAAPSGYYSPFKEGTSARVSQDNDGATSHGGSGEAYAIDFAGSFNVYAPKNGVVDIVSTNSYKIPYCKNNPQHWHGPANYVGIKHDDGLYSYYFHLASTKVKKGDTVTRGETIIGVSGNTGCSTSNHLHFQLASSASMNKAASVRVYFEDIGEPKAGKTYTSKNVPSSGGGQALQKVDVSCPQNKLSVSQTSACLAKAYYSNGTNKDVSKLSSWVVDKSSQASISSGVVTAKGAASDTSVKVSASFEGKTAFTNITVIGLDGKLPADYGCTSDGKNVSSKKITGGEVVLMYSTKCGTNWTRVIPTSNNSITEANVRRTSDSKKYQYKGKGVIYTPMVYSPTTKSCAFGKIGANSVADNTICK